ncbi:MAG: division/cell wall cluster transcriptional repressor MraZ [Candidatus Woesearchaeota archaeon]
MFIGQYDHQLDEKNRLRVPAKLRKRLGKDYIVTKGTNKCLFIFPHEQMQEKLLKKFDNVPIFDDKTRKSIRFILSSAFEVQEDKQGRFVLPKNLKEHAKIKKDIVIIGMGDYLEIWSLEEWTSYFNSDDDKEDIFKGLVKYEV